jgi:pimeloyl-ACP methyl ester carboxylesterase
VRANAVPRHRRRLRALTVPAVVTAAVAAVAVTASGPVAAGAQTAGVQTAGVEETGAGAEIGAAGRPPTVTWSPCPENDAFRCAKLPVPVDWRRPRGEKIELALIRRPSTDPGARIGSLVVHFGGTGTGVDDLLDPDTHFVSAQLARRFDVVAFDARGEGRSHPVTCSAEVLRRVTSRPPDSPADFDLRVSGNRALHEDCRRHTGPLYDHLDNLHDVRDLDAIRTALGETKLTFYGLSAGSLLGQQYAEIYPKRVRALALDSIVDHSLGARGLLDVTALAAQDSFDEFVKWNDRTPSSPLHGRDIRVLLAELYARAERGQLPDPDVPEEPLRADELVRGVTSVLAVPDWALLARLMTFLEDAPPPPSPGSHAAAPGRDGRQQEPELFPIGRGRMTDCANFSLPVRDYADFAGHMLRTRQLAPDMWYGGRTVTMVNCLGAPPATNPQHPLEVRHSPPILVVGALHDPSTPYASAVSLSRQLGDKGTLLTYEGWGHGVYGRGPCVNEAVDRYLISLTTPRQGTRCPALEPGNARAQRTPWKARSGTYEGVGRIGEPFP